MGGHQDLKGGVQTSKSKWGDPSGEDGGLASHRIGFWKWRDMESEEGLENHWLELIQDRRNNETLKNPQIIW